jgi:hypothetical protein
MLGGAVPLSRLMAMMLGLWPINDHLSRHNYPYYTLEETYICDSGFDFEGDIAKWDETAELCNHLDQDLRCEGVRETTHL